LQWLFSERERNPLAVEVFVESTEQDYNFTFVEHKMREP
jgi:hypothetical protein